MAANPNQLLPQGVSQATSAHKLTHFRDSELYLRPATMIDLPSLYALADDYIDLYLQDGDTISPDRIQWLIQNGQVVVIDKFGYVVGAFCIQNWTKGLKADLHFLCRPKHLKTAFRKGLLDKFLERAFFGLDIKKIKISLLSTQKGAMKLARKYKFRHVGLQMDEALFNGEIVGLHLYELTRRYWLKKREEEQGKNVS